MKRKNVLFGLALLFVLLGSAAPVAAQKVGDQRQAYRYVYLPMGCASDSAGVVRCWRGVVGLTALMDGVSGVTLYFYGSDGKPIAPRVDEQGWPTIQNEVITLPLGANTTEFLTVSQNDARVAGNYAVAQYAEVYDGTNWNPSVSPSGTSTWVDAATGAVYSAVGYSAAQIGAQFSVPIQVSGNVDRGVAFLAPPRLLGGVATVTNVVLNLFDGGTSVSTKTITLQPGQQWVGMVGGELFAEYVVAKGGVQRGQLILESKTPFALTASFAIYKQTGLLASAASRQTK